MTSSTSWAMPHQICSACLVSDKVHAISRHNNDKTPPGSSRRSRSPGGTWKHKQPQSRKSSTSSIRSSQISRISSNSSKRGGKRSPRTMNKLKGFKKGKAKDAKRAAKKGGGHGKPFRRKGKKKPKRRQQYTSVAAPAVMSLGATARGSRDAAPSEAEQLCGNVHPRVCATCGVPEVKLRCPRCNDARWFCCIQHCWNAARRRRF